MTYPQHSAAQPVTPPPARSKRQRVIAGVIVVAAVAGVTVVTMQRRAAEAAEIDVTITECTTAGSSDFPLGRAVLEAANAGDDERRVTVSIEFRDGHGTRMGTDRTVVSIGPGGSTRVEETAVLSGTVDGLTCSLLGVG